MKLRLEKSGIYIAVVIEQANQECVLRRFPWPKEKGREMKLNEAMEYTGMVSKVLNCRVEFRQA